jgi:hypothetical protein
MPVVSIMNCCEMSMQEVIIVRKLSFGIARKRPLGGRMSMAEYNRGTRLKRNLHRKLVFGVSFAQALDGAFEHVPIRRPLRCLY